MPASKSKAADAKGATKSAVKATAKSSAAKPTVKPATKPTTAKSAASKPAAKATKVATKATATPVKAPAAKAKATASKTAPPSAKVAPKAKPVTAKKTTEKKESASAKVVKAAATVKAAKAPAEAKKSAAKKASTKAAKPSKTAKDRKSSEDDDIDLSDIEDDINDVEAEAETDASTANDKPVEKVKPLRMKISKAKERALAKEFGLDDTVLSEEETMTRRAHLKALMKLGKTRGYLTHGEINDHLPDKLVEAETLEVVISLLNDMGVAVYEQTPDAETLLLNNTSGTATSEEEAEEEAEAALSTVDSEFGRTTDPVRMYMREMGTVELLTREGEIEIAKRIEQGLTDMVESISESPATIAAIFEMVDEIRQDKVVISTVVDGFSDADENDDYVAEEDFDEEYDDDDGKGGSKSLTKLLEWPRTSKNYAKPTTKTAGDHPTT